MAFGEKLKRRILAFGPGIFLIGYNIGTGSVTTMAASGSRYGMSLFWALVLSCIFTFVMLIAYGRFTLTTGTTALSAYRRQFGKAITIFIMAGLILGEIAALMGITGIVINVFNEWLRFSFGTVINEILLTAVLVIGLFALFWFGEYRRFEKLLMIFVTLMGIGFITSMILVIPSLGEIVRGLVPNIPDEENANLIAAGMAGTTLSAVVFIMRSIVVQEKGWKDTDLKQERRDAFVSASLMLVLSAAVMAAAAGTLFVQNIPVDRAIDMVKTLEPIAGPFAITLFVVGIVSAGLSTVFPIILIAPWLISDYTGKPRNIRSPMYRILAAAGLLLAFQVPVFGGRPVFLMIASQAFQALLMPMVALGIILLINRTSLVGDQKPSLLLNIGCWATFLFSLIMAYSGLVGLIDMVFS